MKMSRRTVRRTAFIGITLLLLVLIQTIVPVLILRNLVSSQEATRLVDLFRAATPGILVALFVTYLYEGARDDYYSRRQEELAGAISQKLSEVLQEDDERRYLQYLRTAPPTELVEAGMQRLYGDDIRLDTLVDNLIPARGLNRDVDIFFSLSDTPGDPSTWSLEIVYRAMIFDLHEYLIALVEGSDTASQLYATCPKLTNVFNFDNAEGAERAAERACANADSLRFMIEYEGKKMGPIKTAALQRVPVSEFSQYGIPAAGPGGKQIILLSAKIPEGANTNVVYIARSLGISDNTSKFCYYYEDRPAFVRKVTFDWTSMTVADARAQHHLIPFYIAKGNPPEVSPEATRIEVIVEQWIWPGQGIMLLW